MPLIRSRGAISAGGGGVRPTRNGSPSLFFPASGAAVIITAPDDASWSDWSQLTADAGEDCVLATINATCSHNLTSADGQSMYVQLGVGADPSSAIIGTWYDRSNTLASYTINRQWRLNGYLLASGTALSFRIRLSAASIGVASNKMAVTVAAPPSPVLFTDDWDEDAYMQGGVSSEELVPAAASWTNVPANGGADTWGSPVELIASAANHQLAYGVNVGYVGTAPPPMPSRIAIQIGVGAEGEEVWHEALPLAGTVTTAGPSGYFELPRSVEVLASDRVAARTQGNLAASKAVNLELVLHNLNF